MEERLGEVIEATTGEFVAQCYELYRLPPLGSLVKTRDEAVELYGIVYQAATSSLEPGRRPIARGEDETSEEAIYQSNPQLLKLLKSEFNALIVGHRLGDKIYQHLPPRPAHIHSFVYACSDDEIRSFSQSFAFLILLLNTHRPVPPEEITGAALREMGRVQEDRHAFLVAAGKELAVLLSDNFSQLKVILGRLKA
ncbi:MAG: hypothetical protein HY670_09785 [Chloroflexi bacterium]|nr:hypothetical protein [Chloroflexota bacterium]